MSRLFVAPLGYHEDFVLRSLVEFRAGTGDVVYVVTCTPVVGAVKKAFDVLVALAGKQGFPQPNLVELDCGDFYGSVKRLRELFAANLEKEVVFCAGGGLRFLTLAILIALFALKKPFVIHYEPEGNVKGFTVKQEFSVNLYQELNEAEKRILKQVMSKPGVSVREIAQALKLREKTVRNVITRLKKRGLVVKRGRREGVEPTEIALALYT